MSTSTAAPADRAAVLDRTLVQVARVGMVTPCMARITFAGPGLSAFPSGPPDQWVRLFLPRPWQTRPLLPASRAWWPELQAMPEDARPILRNYTVRRMRPEAGELDVEFVLHGHDGPASSWAARAAPGDWAGLLAQPGTYHPLPPAGWQLLAGDETALPAIGAILESLVPGTRARVFIEVPGPRDMQDLSTRGEVRITWLPRSAHPGDPSPLLRAIRQAALPEGPPYVWVAGETGLISALRRHLVAERGLDRRSICFCGYWRRGGRGRSDTRLDADGTTRHPG